MPEPLDAAADCAHEQTLAEVLDSFCRQMADGHDPNPVDLLASHKDLAELGDCLEGVAAMEELRSQLGSADEEPAELARTLGDYEIVREIGRGGMGVVYEARHVRLGRRVALKMIKAGDLASPEEVERFQAEARHIASLQHPNIVHIYEVGELAGRPFLALEFVEGTSLDRLIARSPLPPGPAAQLLETLARAMHYAHNQGRHNQGIVHRDLKPANVLLQESGIRNQESSPQPPFPIPDFQTLIPKITDFGLAKRLDTPSAQTQTGAVLGTPSYMAPEQAAGQTERIGPVTDVYSLGAILYEVLTGRPPFKAATPLETLAQVRHDEPLPPRRLQPRLPLDLQTICLKCLHKEPQRRYASAQELADDLGRFQRGEPIRARPIGGVGRLLRWCRRNPVAAGLISVASALLALVIVLTQFLIADAAAAAARIEGRRDEILRSNVYTAHRVANSVLLQLQLFAAAVEQTSRDDDLRRLLQKEQGGADELQKLMERIHRTDPDRGIVGTDGKSAFHTWHVVNRKAILVADAPAAQVNVLNKDFPNRDYFQGALRRAQTNERSVIHVSRVYESENDGMYKITLSAAVRAGADPAAPVVGVVCATLPTMSSLGSLRLNDDRRTALLVSRLDPNPPRGEPLANPADEFLILLHPAYRPGEKPVPVARDQLRVIPQPRPGNELQMMQPSRDFRPEDAMNPAFEDPLGQTHLEFAGRWLAGFFPVGNTEMLVIVQQLDDTASAEPSAGRMNWLIWTAGLLTLTALGAAVCARYWYRRRSTASGLTPIAAAPRPAPDTTVTEGFAPIAPQQQE